MPRGRPRKTAIIEEVEPLSVKDILATTLAEWCGLQGCGPKIHYSEADDLIERLDLAGYKIVKSGEDV